MRWNLSNFDLAKTLLTHWYTWKNRWNTIRLTSDQWELHLNLQSMIAFWLRPNSDMAIRKHEQSTITDQPKNWSLQGQSNNLSSCPVDEWIDAVGCPPNLVRFDQVGPLSNRVLGQQNGSLTQQCEAWLGKPLDKTQCTSDWGHRSVKWHGDGVPPS